MWPPALASSTAAFQNCRVCVHICLHIYVASTNKIAKLTVTQAVKNTNTIPMKSTALFYKQGQVGYRPQILINCAEKERLEISLILKNTIPSYRLKDAPGLLAVAGSLGEVFKSTEIVFCAAP